MPTRANRAVTALMVATASVWAVACVGQTASSDVVDGPTGAARAALNCVGACGSTGDVQDVTDFEYIVVGAGAGGGPLAANLARQGHKVLLLEAGLDTGGSLRYQVPVFHGLSTEFPDMEWDYFVEHYGAPGTDESDDKYYDRESDPQRTGIFYPRSGTLGGCTAHNAMITVYPHESDWDHIADITRDSSWSAANMHQYFRRLERNRDPALARGGQHGTRGWLSVERPSALLALGDFKIKRILRATSSATGAAIGTSGLGELFGSLGRDLNAQTGWERDNQLGMYVIPLATNRGRRSGTREYILETAVDRHFPLAVRTGALVTKVHFADEPAADGTPRADGVEFIDAAHIYRADPNAPRGGALPATVTVRATKEVILAAGAFNTPQLLMLSGIGPAAELARNGIAPRVVLEGVGHNLQDRYEVGVVSSVGSDFALTSDCTFGGPDHEGTTGRDRCLERWQRHTGPYTTNGTVVSVVLRSPTATADPDLFVFGAAAEFRGYEPGYSATALATKNRFTWAILKAHTRNGGGEIRLRSTDPRDTPLVNFHNFDEARAPVGMSGTPDDDLQAMAYGVQFARDIMRRYGTGASEVYPGPSVSDAQIPDWVRRNAWGHHASCSARIGMDGDPDAVLTSDLRVRNVTGLRVVDASVFPRIPGFFIVVPIYMVSEKACDMIHGAPCTGGR